MDDRETLSDEEMSTELREGSVWAEVDDVDTTDTESDDADADDADTADTDTDSTDPS